MINQTQEQLLKNILIQNESITWYQREMRKVLIVIEKLEQNPESFDNPQALFQELQNRLHYLLGKGLFENRMMTRFKEQVQKYC